MTDTFGKSAHEPGERTDGSPFADMMEATRLTGLGRLDEATALIQRSFGFGTQAFVTGQPGPDQPTERVGNASEDVQRSTRVREVVESVVRGLAPVLKGFGNSLRQPSSNPGSQEVTPVGGFFTRSYTDAAGARDYKLFVPSKPVLPAPLIVMLHGCTQNPDDFAAGTGMNTLAERDGIFVAYPAQSRQAHVQRCWNWYEPRDQTRGSGELGIIAGITRTVMEAYPIDPARVYVAGMSAGGAAATNVARAYPDLYAAVGVHSGLAAGCARDLPSALLAMQSGAPGLGTAANFGAATTGHRIPTIVFHGEDDSTVSVRNADHVLAQANVVGLTPLSETFEGRGHPFTRTRYAEASGRVVVEDWRIRGAGHAWSGGRPEGSFTDGDGPDASRAMLAFFGEHRRGAKAR